MYSSPYQSLLGDTALICASRNGHLKSVEALVESGANIHLAGHDAFTALNHAMKNGHEEICELLIKSNPSIMESLSRCYDDHMSLMNTNA